MTGEDRTPEPQRTYSRGTWRALLVLGLIARALTSRVDNRRYNWTIVVISGVLLAFAVVVGIIRT